MKCTDRNVLKENKLIYIKVTFPGFRFTCHGKQWNVWLKCVHTIKTKQKLITKHITLDMQ